MGPRLMFSLWGPCCTFYSTGGVPPFAGETWREAWDCAPPVCTLMTRRR